MVWPIHGFRAAGDRDRDRAVAAAAHRYGCARQVYKPGGSAGMAPATAVAFEPPPTETCLPTVPVGGEAFASGLVADTMDFGAPLTGLDVGITPPCEYDNPWGLAFAGDPRAPLLEACLGVSCCVGCLAGGGMPASMLSRHFRAGEVMSRHVSPNPANNLPAGDTGTGTGAGTAALHSLHRYFRADKHALECLDRVAERVNGAVGPAPGQAGVVVLDGYWTASDAQRKGVVRQRRHPFGTFLTHCVQVHKSPPPLIGRVNRVVWLALLCIHALYTCSPGADRRFLQFDCMPQFAASGRARHRGRGDPPAASSRHGVPHHARRRGARSCGVRPVPPDRCRAARARQRGGGAVRPVRPAAAVRAGPRALPGQRLLCTAASTSFDPVIAPASLYTTV